jgi:hypothetical protein
MRSMPIAIITFCLCWLASTLPVDTNGRVHAVEDAQNDDLQSEFLHSALRVTPSWNNDFIDLAEVNDTISVNGSLRLRDQAKLKSKRGTVLIIRTLPDGRDLIMNSKGMNFDMREPGEYIFGGNIRGPDRVGIYRVEIRSHGKVIMKRPLEIR